MKNIALIPFQKHILDGIQCPPSIILQLPISNRYTGTNLWGLEPLKSLVWKLLRRQLVPWKSRCCRTGHLFSLVESSHCCNCQVVQLVQMDSSFLDFAVFYNPRSVFFGQGWGKIHLVSLSILLVMDFPMISWRWSLSHALIKPCWTKWTKAWRWSSRSSSPEDEPARGWLHTWIIHISVILLFQHTVYMYIYIYVRYTYVSIKLSMLHSSRKHLFEMNIYIYTHTHTYVYNIYT